MVVVNMHEAKTRLSELVRLVEAGEQVVLARNGTPVAELVPAAVPEPKQRRGGQWKGKVWISPDFDEPLPELERALHGDDR
jgi:prevent-host-death family protein